MGGSMTVVEGAVGAPRLSPEPALRQVARGTPSAPHLPQSPRSPAEARTAASPSPPTHTHRAQCLAVISRSDHWATDWLVA